MIGKLLGSVITGILIGKGAGELGDILKATKTGAALVEKAEKLKVLTSAKIGESFSDEAASAAASRLRGRLQQATLYAGVPADALIDLAVVATNKVKNGVKDFTEFSKQMVVEFGESVRPELRKAFDKGVDAVYGSRRDLDLHELLGGHTIEKHVGKTEKWLRERLKKEPDIRSASSFYNKEVANRAQIQTTKLYGKEFDEWAKNSASDFPIKRVIEMNEPAGIVVMRGKDGIQISSKVEVRVVKDNTERGWHIISTFPLPK